jgi:endogenous inhibitor of DNA gyrase (YacG/DUF329 family)
MAKRIENECAFCAEEIIEGEEMVGKDWKVYCSEQCAEAGEKISLEEWQKAMERGENGAVEQGDREIKGQETSLSLSPCSTVPASSILAPFSLRGI